MVPNKEIHKKEIVKEIIRQLHEGEIPEEVTAKFKDLMKDLSPDEISRVEEELVKEGIPVEEIRRLCDVHLAVFKESLEEEKPLVPAGHPIDILMEEHKMLLGFADELRNLSKGFKAELVNAQIERMKQIVEHLKSSDNHYLREENVLFPSLEKHGVTQPPAIMWMEHNQIREIEKNLYKQFGDHQEVQGFEKMREVSTALAEMLSSHFYKENNILFPTALKVIGKDEWRNIGRQFDDMGYCDFTPRDSTVALDVSAPTEVQRPEASGLFSLETGDLSKGQIEAIFKTLPVDVTFIDKNDIVRYFSETKDRIFVRTKAIIGRRVQQCHPQKSLDRVNQILEAFKRGSKDVAEFWLDLKGRLIHIRYFALRDKKGEYLGCVEVTQDITSIKKIEGEKRLLDWT